MNMLVRWRQKFLGTQKLIHPDWVEYFKNEWKNLLDGHVAPFYEYQIIDNSGKIRWLNQRNTLVRDEKGKSIAIEGVVTDITERKNSEEAKKESEERLRELVDTINSGVAIYKVINDGKTGKDYIIQDFNKCALELEGLKKEDVIGKSLFDLRPNIDEYGLISIFRKVWETGEPAFYPAKIYADDNYSNYYENRIFKMPNGEITAIYDDVSEKENILAEVKESEAKFKTVFESANIGKSVTRIGGKMSANKAFADMLGYTTDELNNKTWQEITPEEEIGRIQNIVTPLIKGDVNSVRFEKRYIHKDGHFVWADVSIVLQIDSVGTPQYFITSVVNITDKKKVEKELEEHRHNLEELVAERTKELKEKNLDLERLNKLFVNREFRIKELRDELKRYQK
jgi:PAS domain S-box-containing protein